MKIILHIFNRTLFVWALSLLISFSFTARAQEASWTTGGASNTGTLQEAFDSVDFGGEIQLLTDVSLTTSIYLYEKTVILNGAGFTVKRAADFTSGDMFTMEEDKYEGDGEGEDDDETLLTLKNITLDGGAVWDAESGVNNGITAAGSTLKLTGGARLVIDEGTVIENGENSLTSSNSGIINVNKSHIVMNGGILRNNKCSANGGAVFVNSESGMILNGGEIYKNSARNGGAIAINSSSSALIVNGGNIYENSASSSGGGGAIWAKGAIMIRGGSLYGNYASSNGGALYLLSGGVIIGGTIRDNVAEENGDGVYLFSGSMFAMGDSAYIDSSNELFMLSSQSITFTSPLTRHSSSNKLVVNTTYTYDNTLIATFIDNTKSETELHEAAQAGLEYITHAKECALSASDNTIVIGNSLSDVEFVATEGKYYTIRRNGNTSSYISENGSLLAVGEYSNSTKCYWTFESTGTPGRYYIKNATSGSYIQSTNVAVSSTVTTGNTPVEFYIAKDESAGASTYGYYYLCSTDQSIDNKTDATLGLNFGSGSVVAYYIKTGRPNSYWEIEEQEYDYEVVTFNTTPSINDREVASKYHLTTQDNHFVGILNGSLGLEGTATENNAWYFVSASNEREGVVIANYNYEGYTLNLIDGQLLFSKVDEPSRWYIKEVTGSGGRFYNIIPFAYKESGEYLLTVEGENLFSLTDFRTDFAKSLQFYYYPCGERVNGGTYQYLTNVSVTGENVLRELNYTATARPATYYELVVSSKGTVSVGLPFLLNIEGCSLGTATNNITGMELYVYFDWNGDGVFETCLEKMSEEASYTTEIAVPADASLGLHRMRIRATTNELGGPEEDVSGCTYDFILNVATAQPLRTVSVQSNAATRGEVTLSQEGNAFAYDTELTATALPLGNSSFLYWKDGKTILSTESTFTFKVTQNMELTAYFSPNTLAPEAIENVVVSDDKDEKKTGVFDLQGRRIVAPTKDGIYIINGNKYLIKNK